MKCNELLKRIFPETWAARFTGRLIKNSGMSNKFHAAANERQNLPQLPLAAAPYRSFVWTRGEPIGMRNFLKVTFSPYIISIG